MKSLVLLLVGLATANADNVAVQEFTKANNLFAAAAYKEALPLNKENFLMSPLSAEIVTALAQSGAKDETAEEMRKGLYLPNNNKNVESAMKSLLPTLKSNEDYTLHAANKIYVKENFKINEDFLQSAKEAYQVEVENINFTKNEAAARTMNEWVEKQTANKIQNLISPDLLDGDTRTVLINALYLKANWSQRFTSELTKKDNFYKTEQDVVEVDTMHQYRENFKYYESSELNAKFLELPYKGGDVSMTIILPHEKDGLARLEKQIDKVLTAHELENELVNVALPKFKIESTFNFKKILENLGVKKAFDESEADLSGIAGKKGDLIIKDIIQKTYIDVDEGGVEAAAATFVVVPALISAPYPVPVVQPKEFIADHPFIFYIKVKDLIIFVGKIVAPSYN